MNGKYKNGYVLILSDLLAVALVFLLNMLLLDKGKCLTDVLMDTLYIAVPALLAVHGMAWLIGKRRCGGSASTGK